MARGPTVRPIDRASPNDLTNLAVDRGPTPMNIGAVLVVEDGNGLSPESVRELLAERLPAVPRMSQRLHRAPMGCGRPFWADDPGFDLDRHLGSVALTTVASEDEACPRELLDLAANLVCRHLPRDRPLWAAQWVTGLGNRAALVLVVHHAMADGLGGLAVLAALGDNGDTGDGGESADGRTAEPSTVPANGAVPTPAKGLRVPRRPQSPPTRVALVADAWRERTRRLRTIPGELRSAGRGIRELGLGLRRPRLAPSTSLNLPTRPCRRLTRVSMPLAPVVALAHARGCTVNDVILTAVVGAMYRTLEHRGEHPDELVVSVPISSRRSASSDELGNRTGVVPMTLPTAGPAATRLEAVAGISRARRQGPPGASAGPMGAVFRLLARVGLFQRFIERQRLVNTFVTNVRGPAAPLTFGGREVSAVVPVAVNSGNVGVSFDVMSYAGQLGITVVADPHVVPDQDSLTELLEAELAELLDAQGRGRVVSP